ncbi:MAG: hypothetical protein K2Y18_04010 [Alphaproteobacteria bacterium]|jgi:hypothetical protein|nr:hypothetical protein [Alphaproteobacteria bacterium]
MTMKTSITLNTDTGRTAKNHSPEQSLVTKIVRNLMVTGFTLGVLSCPKAMDISLNQKPDQVVRRVAYGYLPARALHVASEHKLFDVLQDGKPKTAADIASGKGFKAESVKRLMRVLANHQIVTMNDDETFSLNENSSLLISTAENSLQPAIAKESDKKRWEAVGQVGLALTNDDSPFDQLNGMDYYAYLEQNPKAMEQFNKGMRNFSEREDDEVSRAQVFKGHKSYCDIGGGTGGLLSRVLGQNPNLEGILFDLAGTVKDCTLPNVKMIGGSFFEVVPAADVYTIKRVLHNWKDEDCVTILKNTRTALSDQQNGRIFVIEKVFPKTVDGSLLIDSDIIALAMGGQERTLSEFIKIGKQAKLELDDQITLATGVSILVFKPFQ